MENKKPFISVVIPVYNVERYLKKAVESVLKQSFQDFEIILVDDCSKDGSLKLCEQMAKKDSRIKVIHHEYNQGLSKARNSGLKVSSGQYIWFMDSDDYVDDGLFISVKQSLDQNPAELVVFGLTEDYYDENDCLHHSKIIMPDKKIISDQDTLRKNIIELERQTLYGYAWNKIYDLEYLKKAELAFEDITLIEDILFNVKYCMNIKKMNVIPFAGYHYNKRMDNSLTSKFVPDYYKLHRKRIDLICRQYKYWKMYNNDIKAILGALYVRYIFSAIQRNCDKRAGMSWKTRRKWIKGLLNEVLLKELLPYALSDGKLLEVMILILKTGNVTGIQIVGRGIYICKNEFPMIFSILKQKR